jgi:hypothetical protein
MLSQTFLRPLLPPILWINNPECIQELLGRKPPIQLVTERLAISVRSQETKYIRKTPNQIIVNLVNLSTIQV